MLTILCGLEEEAKIIKDRRNVQVLWGTARTKLDVVVARGCTAILSFGVSGALHPHLRVGDLIVGKYLTDGVAFRTLMNRAWCKRLAEKLPLAGEGEFYSNGEEGANNAAERGALFSKTSAIAIDDETIYAARFARDVNIPFAAVRAISDGYDTVVPTWIMKTVKEDGSANLDEVFKHLDQTFDMIALAVNFGKALGALTGVYRMTGPQFCWEET